MTEDGHEGAVLHRPPEDAPGAGAMYLQVSPGGTDWGDPRRSGIRSGPPTAAS